MSQFVEEVIISYVVEKSGATADELGIVFDWDGDSLVALTVSLPGGNRHRIPPNAPERDNIFMVIRLWQEANEHERNSRVLQEVLWAAEGQELDKHTPPVGAGRF